MLERPFNPIVLKSLRKFAGNGLTTGSEAVNNNGLGPNAGGTKVSAMGVDV